MQIRDTPHAIAGGLAIGVFFGMTPLIGLKTALALVVAWLTRCSKISAVIAVTLHDVLIPIAPIIFRWQYNIGFWLLSSPHHLPKRFRFEEFHIDAFLHWRTLKILWPTLVGSLVLAIPLGFITYFIALRVIEQAHVRRDAREREQAEKEAEKARLEARGSEEEVD